MVIGVGDSSAAAALVAPVAAEVLSDPVLSDLVAPGPGAAEVLSDLVAPGPGAAEVLSNLLLGSVAEVLSDPVALGRVAAEVLLASATAREAS